MLITIRHGETDYNKMGRYSGRGDKAKITSEAHKQAYELGKELVKYDLEIACLSPLKRAKETFEEINKTLNIPFIVINGLIERDYKEYEGKPYATLPRKDYWKLDCVSEYDIESTSSVIARVEEALNEIRDKYHDKNVLIVAHAGICRVIRYLLEGKKVNNLREYPMENLQVYEYREW